MSIRGFHLFLAVATLPLGAHAADPVQEILEQAALTCRDFEDGTLSQRFGAITRADLTGDGVTDIVIDEAGFNCTSAASLFWGTGGSALHLIVDGQVTTVLSKGWQVLDLGQGRAVILLAVHGSDCGGEIGRVCYEALSWEETEETFVSLRTPYTSPDGG